MSVGVASGLSCDMLFGGWSLTIFVDIIPNVSKFKKFTKIQTCEYNCYTCTSSYTCTYIQCYMHDSCIHTHTLGFAGWGIAWYIDETLIPELVVQRGLTYTFIVYGGDDPSDPGNYHPFYITDSRTGGRLLNMQDERDVRKENDLKGLFTYTCMFC